MQRHFYTVSWRYMNDFIQMPINREYYWLTRIFLGLISGRISAPSQFKMVYIIPNFLVLQFGENFMKIGTKIAKLQMHENLHKNVNENMFSFTFLCKYS